MRIKDRRYVWPQWQISSLCYGKQTLWCVSRVSTNPKFVNPGVRYSALSCTRVFISTLLIHWRVRLAKHFPNVCNIQVSQNSQRRLYRDQEESQPERLPTQIHVTSTPSSRIRILFEIKEWAVASNSGWLQNYSPELGKRSSRQFWKVFRRKQVHLPKLSPLFEILDEGQNSEIKQSYHIVSYITLRITNNWRLLL